MPELLQTLYEYARKKMSISSIEEETLYQETSEMCEKNYQKLCARLSEEEREHLQSYLDDAAVLHSLELEAAFRAGLSIALELSRL